MNYILLALTPPAIVAIIVAAIVLLILIFIFANARIVPQASEFIIERLGKYKTTWKAGFHVLVPFFEKISNKVTIKEQVIDSKPQPVITKDNVTVNIDSIVYFKVFDSVKFTYGAVDPVNALENLTTTTLRNIIGTMSLDETLTSRDNINAKMATLLDEATNKWGIDVLRVELSQIMLPQDVRESMEKQMKAERDKREAILLAEAHQESVVKRAEGDKQAKILAAEGERDAQIAKAEGEARSLFLKQQAEADALKILKEAVSEETLLELKRYEAMVAVSNGQAAKIIVPTDMMSIVKKGVVLNETVGIGNLTQAAEAAPTVIQPDPCCDKRNENL